MVQHKKSRHLQRGILVFSIVILIAGILALLVHTATSGKGIQHPIVRLQHKNTIKKLSDNAVTLKPQLSNAILLNPGKGWVLYGMPSDHLASTLAYATVGYMRYDWSTIEPTEGHYNWSVIDAGLNAWKAQGKQFAFGAMNADSSNANPNGWAAGTVTLETTALTLSNLKSGTYKLAVGLFLNPTDTNPTYKIGNQGGTTNGWYVLSSNLTVT